MAKFIERLKDTMFGGRDDDYDDYDDEDYEDDEEELEAPRYIREPSYSAPSRSSSRRNPHPSSVVSINANVQMQVVIIKPECYAVSYTHLKSYNKCIRRQI